MDYIKNNELLKTFRELKGNPKWSLITEPLWYIPYSLFSPFASLYMYQRGLSSEQIGLIISIGFALQVFFAFIGGIITDKCGRRWTTFVFDFISWSIPCFIWAIADSFWLFLVAAVINSSYQITNASWNCLFIEDCPPKHLTNAFTLIYLAGMLSVIFSPIAVVLVDEYSVIQVVSVLYFISGISMSLKFILLYIFGRETQQGILRKEETKNISYFEMFKGYKDVISSVVKSSKMRFVVLFMAITNIILISTTNFFSIYVTEELNISDKLVAVFPMLRTFIMLAFVLILQNTMNRLQMKKSLLAGFAVYIASHLMLLLAPKGNLLLVCVYTVLEAMAFAIISPRKDALMAFYVEVKNRSRIYAIFNAGMIALSAPFGYIIGKMFDINAMYPFVFNIVLFVLSMLLILKVKAIVNYEAEVSEE